MDTQRQKHLVLILARQFASNLATPTLITDERGYLVYYNEAAEAVATIERIVAEEGLTLLGWREVPVDPENAGRARRGGGGRAGQGRPSWAAVGPGRGREERRGRGKGGEGEGDLTGDGDGRPNRRRAGAAARAGVAARAGGGG